ncbi:hypothetical protein AKJ16_DCAP18578 [Drosera capensis]
MRKRWADFDDSNSIFFHFFSIFNTISFLSKTPENPHKFKNPKIHPNQPATSHNKNKDSSLLLSIEFCPTVSTQRGRKRWVPKRGIKRVSEKANKNGSSLHPLVDDSVRSCWHLLFIVLPWVEAAGRG